MRYAAIFDLPISSGMGSKKTAIRFREQLPAIPVFEASGYSEDPAIANPMEFGFTGSIRKPFTKSDLAELLNKHLRIDTAETV